MYIEMETEQNNVHFFEHTMPKESSKGKEMASFVRKSCLWGITEIKYMYNVAIFFSLPNTQCHL